MMSVSLKASGIGNKTVYVDEFRRGIWLRRCRCDLHVRRAVEQVQGISRSRRNGQGGCLRFYARCRCARRFGLRGTRSRAGLYRRRRRRRSDEFERGCLLLRGLFQLVRRPLGFHIGGGSRCFKMGDPFRRYGEFLFACRSLCGGGLCREEQFLACCLGFGADRFQDRSIGFADLGKFLGQAGRFSLSVARVRFEVGDSLLRSL